MSVAALFVLGNETMPVPFLGIKGHVVFLPQDTARLIDLLGLLFDLVTVRCGWQISTIFISCLPHFKTGAICMFIIGCKLLLILRLAKMKMIKFIVISYASADILIYLILK